MTNYSEQVNNTIDQMILFNEIATVYPDYMYDMAEQHGNGYDLPYFDTDNTELLKAYNLTVDDNLESINDALDEFVQENDEFYQIYMVTLKGGYDDEAKKLGIFEHEGQYFLPVSHVGTSWDYVSSVDFTTVDDSIINEIIENNK